MGRISQFDLFSITGPGPCTEENAEQLKSMEAVGIESERGREGEEERRNWNERHGEMKRKRRKSPGREESPRETIGLDRERERERRRECLINGLFI